ncbi:GTP-binding protein [Roseivirga ehrenbergii]|uniref:Probable GTP-binding protein EngB n=1 Tax=Roseivirga ehrenbergii (strain DSM 102268 / JCM 13514 / KCTC 12282 / NCIMB 14502 / KMM 6017) TaxID=279360 RepID=A0A150X0F7_ROSEK|nr:ribosome biogenesis GTP-binding protein YihA/YsxC [Roseivirga ehrenbergii]KYG72208.1 GTP-binding protein [Roseivirga ehrenbergii]TCL13445.1 GTP-binding protein [Roseivirga ehrenbergii]
MFENASFVISNTDHNLCPKPDKPEFAFIGRSNVGKSSLINMLTQKKNLAKTSGRPGKTQLINHFIVDDQWYLVDLPGYGYAKTSKSNRVAWSIMIEKYLLERENLQMVFVLIDSRLEPQKIDIEFVTWLGESGIPLGLIFTKADKQSINKTQQSIARFRKVMKQTWEELPVMFVSSAETGLGREEIAEYIHAVLTT